MASFDRIKPGDVLYDVHRYKTNAAGSRTGCWPVRIVSVDREKRTARVVWNTCNPEQTYREHAIKRLRRSPPKAKER